MKQVQLATKEQQPLSSIVGRMTYLYIQDISEAMSDLGGLVKKEALFSGLGHMKLHFRGLKIKIVKMSALHTSYH